MTDITKHVALRKLYEASLSLERLPASPEQTATAILISDASQSVDALVSEVNRIQNVAIMSDFTFMAAQELREAVEPFRCDTFGCEASQSEQLDKACAALDRVQGNGLLKAAKDAEITRLRAELERVRESLTAAVQGEREAIKAALTEIAMIEHRASSEYFGSGHPVVGERWNNHAMGIEHAIEIIEKRPSPAVDVMAVVREYVESSTDLDPERGPQRYREALAALTALVSPTTTGMAKDGDKWDRTNEEEYRAHVEQAKDGGAK